MPYLIVEVSEDQNVTLGKLFANQVTVTDSFNIDIVHGMVVEIGSDLKEEE